MAMHTLDGVSWIWYAIIIRGAAVCVGIYTPPISECSRRLDGICSAGRSHGAEYTIWNDYTDSLEPHVRVNWTCGSNGQWSISSVNAVPE